MEKLWKDYEEVTDSCLRFIEEHFEGIVPAGRLSEEIVIKTGETYAGLCRCMEENADTYMTLEAYLTAVKEYFQPGELAGLKDRDRKACRNITLNAVQMIANLTVWLMCVSLPQPQPSFPEEHGQEDFTEFVRKAAKTLGLEACLKMQWVHSGHEIKKLFSESEK